jgi:hypothetical protein
MKKMYGWAKNKQYCKHKHCWNDMIDNSKYCKEHRCRGKSCDKLVMENFLLCEDHKCETIGCDFGIYVDKMCAECFLKVNDNVRPYTDKNISKTVVD